MGVYRDWQGLQEEYLHGDWLSMKAFAAAKDIPYSTARKNLRASDKRASRERVIAEARQMVESDRATDLVKTLQSHGAISSHLLQKVAEALAALGPDGLAAIVPKTATEFASMAKVALDIVRLQREQLGLKPGESEGDTSADLSLAPTVKRAVDLRRENPELVEALARAAKARRENG